MLIQELLSFYVPQFTKPETILLSVSRRAVSQFTPNIKKIKLQLFILLPYYNIYQEMPSCHSPESFSPEAQIQSQWVCE
jgi:hypothetical protein